jgi:hypothetical protein
MALLNFQKRNGAHRNDTPLFVCCNCINVILWKWRIREKIGSDEMAYWAWPNYTLQIQGNLKKRFLRPQMYSQHLIWIGTISGFFDWDIRPDRLPCRPTCWLLWAITDETSIASIGEGIPGPRTQYANISRVPFCPKELHGESMDRWNISFFTCMAI